MESDPTDIRTHETGQERMAAAGGKVSRKLRPGDLARVKESGSVWALLQGAIQGHRGGDTQRVCVADELTR